MKAITLIEMMKQEEYQCLTCKEFAEIVDRAGVIEYDTIEVGDDLSWLDTAFVPDNVIYHTNRDEK